MPIHLCVLYGCYHAMITELSSYKRDYMAHKAENIYHRAFTVKVCLALFYASGSQTCLHIRIIWKTSKHTIACVSLLEIETQLFWLELWDLQKMPGRFYCAVEFENHNSRH